MDILKIYGSYKGLNQKSLQCKGIMPSLLSVALLLLVSCQSVAQKRIVAFAEATNEATTNVEESFNAVENNYFNTQVLKLIANYDPNKGFNVREIKPFLDPDDLEKRKTALEAVSTYAKMLGEIMSDDKLKEFDDSTKSFGEELKNFNDSDTRKALSKVSVPVSDIDAFTTSVNTIGRWLIEYKREKEVKQVVILMNPHVEKICDLLFLDIGPAKGPGLREQLSRQYETQMQDMNSYISKNYEKLSVLELREELNKLAQMPIQQKKADLALSAAGQSLVKLKEAHRKLSKAFDPEAPDLEALIRQLSTESKRAKNYYDALNK